MIEIRNQPRSHLDKSRVTEDSLSVSSTKYFIIHLSLDFHLLHIFISASLSHWFDIVSPFFPLFTISTKLTLCSLILYLWSVADIFYIVEGRKNNLIYYFRNYEIKFRLIFVRHEVNILKFFKKWFKSLLNKILQLYLKSHYYIIVN